MSEKSFTYFCVKMNSVDNHFRCYFRLKEENNNESPKIENLVLYVETLSLVSKTGKFSSFEKSENFGFLLYVKTLIKFQVFKHIKKP